MAIPHYNLSKAEIERLVKSKLQDYRGHKVLHMGNYARDFTSSFVYRGVTKSGRVKLGDIHTEGPNGIQFKNVMGKVRKDPYSGKLSLSTLGSRYHLDL